MAQAALVVLLALSLHAGGSGVAQAVAVVASCVCRCKLEEQALRAGPRSHESRAAALPSREGAACLSRILADSVWQRVPRRQSGGSAAAPLDADRVCVRGRAAFAQGPMPCPAADL